MRPHPAVLRDLRDDYHEIILTNKIHFNMKTRCYLTIAVQIFAVFFTGGNLSAQHPVISSSVEKFLKPERVFRINQIEFPSQQNSQAQLRDVFLLNGFFANYWDKNLQSWTPYDSGIYTYVGPGNYLYQQLNVRWDTTSQTWMDSWHYTNFYNSDYQITGFLSEFWNGVQWDSSYRYLYSYDFDGNISSYMTQYYDIDVWVNQSQYFYEYDSSGSVTSDTTQIWDAMSSAWVNALQSQYTYDGDLLTEELRDQWNTVTSSWDKLYKIDFTYNNYEVETQYVQKVWNAGTTTWDNLLKLTITLDADNYPLEWLYKNWNAGTSQYDNSTRYDFTYDANHNRTSFDNYNWMAASSSWLEVYIDSSFFDQNNNGVHELTWSYDFIDSMLESSYEFFYWYNDINNQVNSSLSESSSLNLFPNPASDVMTVSIQSEQNSEALLDVLDLTGRIIFKQKLQLHAGNNSLPINTSLLNGGTYRIVLSDKKNKIEATKIFVKQ